MEKQLTLSDIQIIFTRNIDLEIYLLFQAKQILYRTQILKKGGKIGTWRMNVVMNIGNCDQIGVKVCFQGAEGRQELGSCIISVKSIKSSGGQLQAEILQRNGSQLGTLSTKYSVQSSATFPLLLLKNIRYDIQSPKSKIQKLSIQICSIGNMSQLKAKKKPHFQHLQFQNATQIKIRKNQIITFVIKDQSNDNKEIINCQIYAEEFKKYKVKKIYARNKGFQLLGVLSFQYQTINFGNSGQTDRSIDSQANNQQIQVSVQSLKGTIPSTGTNLFIKLIIGPNTFKTKGLQQYQKDFILQVNQIFYCDKSDNKMIFAVYDQQSGQNYRGLGEYMVNQNTSGKVKISLEDSEENYLGELTINAKSKKVAKRELDINNIKVKTGINSKVLGSMLVGSIGCWSCKTEVVPLDREITFSKQLVFIFGDDKKIAIKLVDEEQTTIYQLQKYLEDFKELGEMTLPLTSKTLPNERGTTGEIYFKYKLKNGANKIKSPTQSKKSIQKQKQKPIQKQKPTQKQKEQQKYEQHNEQKNKNIPQQQQVQQDSPTKPKKKQQKTQSKISENKYKKSTITSKQDNYKKDNSPQGQNKKYTQNDKNQEEYQQTNNLQNQAKQHQKQSLNKNNNSNQNKKQNYSNNKKQLKNNNNNNNDDQGEEQYTHQKQQKPHKKSQHQQKQHQEISRQTIKFPAIQTRNYGDKIYDKQSSSTLQKSIHVYSVPKATRFVSGPKYTGQPTFYIDSCFKSHGGKGTGFGYGTKRQFPDWLQRNMKQYPAPGSYFDHYGTDGTVEFRLKGPTFGIAHKYYQKVLIPKENKEKNYTTAPVRKTPQKTFGTRK